MFIVYLFHWLFTCLLYLRCFFSFVFQIFSMLFTVRNSFIWIYAKANCIDSNTFFQVYCSHFMSQHWHLFVDIFLMIFFTIFPNAIIQNCCIGTYNPTINATNICLASNLIKLLCYEIDFDSLRAHQTHNVRLFLLLLLLMFLLICVENLRSMNQNQKWIIITLNLHHSSTSSTISSNTFQRAVFYFIDLIRALAM